MPAWSMFLFSSILSLRAAFFPRFYLRSERIENWKEYITENVFSIYFIVFSFCAPYKSELAPCVKTVLHDKFNKFSANQFYGIYCFKSNYCQWRRRTLQSTCFTFRSTVNLFEDNCIYEGKLTS